MKKFFLTASLIAALPVILLSIGTASAQDPNESQPGLKMEKKEVLRAAMGVKSLVMDADCSNVYSMNLEGMSVYDFDRQTRQLKRKLVFVPHKGRGYNYQTHKWFEDSFQEKPVEARLTHGGRYLWISLHNAGGVVVWDLQGGNTYVEGRPYKEAWLYERGPIDSSQRGLDSAWALNPPLKFKKKMVKLLLIKTGTTPKVIASTPDGKYLFVANWHSNSVSEISIKSDRPEDWVKVRDLKGLVIPRGLAVSPDSKSLYVAQMGGSVVSVVNIPEMKKVRTVRVGVNPRHIVMDGRFMYVSLNKVSELVKVDLRTGKVVKKAGTGSYPRTIAVSEDGEVIFAACYKGDLVQAFSARDLHLLGSWKSIGHPVAVKVYQKNGKMEAWVGDYTAGQLNVFTFLENSPSLEAGN